MWNVPIWVEIEPLASLRVPGNGQRLEPTTGKRNEILLQWLKAKRIRYLEFG